MITVRTTPAIDGVENQLDHIFKNPQEFINDIIYKWIDKHSWNEYPNGETMILRQSNDLKYEV